MGSSNVTSADSSDDDDGELPREGLVAPMAVLRDMADAAAAAAAGIQSVRLVHFFFLFWGFVSCPVSPCWVIFALRASIFLAPSILDIWAIETSYGYRARIYAAIWICLILLHQTVLYAAVDTSTAMLQTVPFLLSP